MPSTATPAVSKPIATSAYVATDKVAVIVDVPPSSATVASLTASVTVGALSPSVIVIVSDWLPLSVAPPPETAEIDITAVSSDAASYNSSAIALKIDVAAVDPAEIVIGLSV